MEENGLPVDRRASRASRQDEQDEDVLAEFGYKQELKRDWGLTHNFGISFSIIVCFSISQLLLPLAVGLMSFCRKVSYYRYHDAL